MRASSSRITLARKATRIVLGMFAISTGTGRPRGRSKSRGKTGVQGQFSGAPPLKSNVLRNKARERMTPVSVVKIV